MSGWNPNIANPAPGWVGEAEKALDLMGDFRELSDCCNECNAYTHEDDAAPSCGSHRLCVPCYTTSDFRCRECRRVWTEVGT